VALRQNQIAADIGRKSANGATLPERVLDGYSIRQEASDPGRIALVLRDGAGYEKRLGSYAPDVIYRALLFAADGRPLVVTIVNTELGGVQKVILHPVLIDTAIGCEMIELDKFVFSYIRKDIRDANSAEMRRVQGYDALYSLARLYGVRALVKAEYQPELDALISSYIEDHSRETLQSALRDPLLFSDIKRSPLAANYHIYGKPVIDAMKMCVAKRRDTLDAFGDCLTHAARTVTTNEQAREWLKQPKPLEFVSGVRDRSYSLDVDLKFLDGAAKTDTHGVLQFLIQDTDSTGDTDTNVWSFDSLTPAIEEGVKTLIKTNPQATTILRNSEDFAVLQRLFRLIFDGQLRGPQLLSQVASLAKQLGPQVKDKVSTARWNPSQSPIGVNEARSVAKSYEALGADAQSSAPTPPEVQSALTILAACADAARAPDRFMWASTWQAHCSFDNVRETLAASCRANLARDTLLCRLSAIANFANATWAKIKLAEVMGMPINATPEPKTPKACRAAL
jgi:hypothetical protein